MCHKLDAIVWDYISNLIQDKERVKANIRLLKEKREKDRVSNQRVYDSLVLEKEKLKMKIGRLLELYADNEFSKEDLKVKIDEIKEKEAILDNQIGEIKGELKKIDDMEAIEEEVEKLCDLYQNNIRNATFEQKRYIVKKWIKEINILKDGRIIVKVNLPVMELPKSLSMCQMATYTT
jgi:site-specific DNA recombinase